MKKIEGWNRILNTHHLEIISHGKPWMVSNSFFIPLSRDNDDDDLNDNLGTCS